MTESTYTVTGRFTTRTDGVAVETDRDPTEVASR